MDSNAAVNNGQAVQSKTSLAADFDAFLLLLTTQLKNQDPLSPMEPTEFTSQLVQFASVEQQINANENLEKMIGIQNASLAASIIGFIGTDVEYDGASIPLQDGSAKFTYDLADKAKNVVITISDADGNLVLTEAGETTAGLHEFVWDGKDTNGVQKPDGTYTISVTAVDGDQQAIDTKIHGFGHITGVSMANGTVLNAGDLDIPLDSILNIAEPGTNTPPPSAGDA